MKVRKNKKWKSQMTIHRTDQTTQYKKGKKKTQKKYFLSWTKCILYAVSLTMCGISTFFKSLSQRNIKLLYFQLNLTTVLFLIASINTDYSLQYKTCNTGYKHKHSAQKLYLVLNLQGLLEFYDFFFSCDFDSHAGSLEAEVVSNKDLFLQKVAFR